jgi:hypothetical protein
LFVKDCTPELNEALSKRSESTLLYHNDQYSSDPEIPELSFLIDLTFIRKGILISPLSSKPQTSACMRTNEQNSIGTEAAILTYVPEIPTH